VPIVVKKVYGESIWAWDLLAGISLMKRYTYSKVTSLRRETL